MAKKKLLENPIVAPMVVPLAVVLVGAMITMGVSKMLSAERSYKDLVRGMHTKKFGNRWAQAYELSKVILAKKIPEEDWPWLIEELSSLYSSSQGPRDKEFLIVAAGAVRSSQALPLLARAFEETGPGSEKIKFHAVVALAHMEDSGTVDWAPVIRQLDNQNDAILQQAAILALSSKKVEVAREKVAQLLSSQNRSLRYAAATGLVAFQDPRAQTVLTELMGLSPEGEGGFDAQKVRQLKLNVLAAVEREQWRPGAHILASTHRGDPSIWQRAQQVLNKLKK